MHWAKVNVEMLDLNVPNEALGIWLRAVLYLVEKESSDGHMLALGWSSPFSDDDISLLQDNFLIEPNGCLSRYPADEVAAMHVKRAKGKIGGKSGGRPRKNPTGLNNENPQGLESKNPAQKPREEKIRLEETREDNTKGASESNQDQVTFENPYKGCDGQPAKDGTEQSRPVNPEAKWQMIQMEPWAMALKKAGCKIGKGSWMQWQDILERLFQCDADRLTEFSRKVDASVRFAGEVESRYATENPTAHSSGAIDL